MFSGNHRYPVVTREAYRAFVSFMFAAAMLAWGATLLGLTLLGQPVSIQAVPIQLPNAIQLISGILYGGVLICFYWLYSEILATQYPPTNLLLLLLDFIVLSFMTGTAASWRDAFNFNVLAFVTLALLAIRFAIAARFEWWPPRAPRKRFREMMFTHIFSVYVAYFIVLVIFLIGRLSGQQDVTISVGLANVMKSNGLLFGLWFGMAMGIGVTGAHSMRHIPVRSLSQPVQPTLEFNNRSTLVPAYGVIPERQLPIVVKHVFRGEERFRQFLRSVDSRWVSPLDFHESSVHTYRDVETQAFIMAHHAVDPDEIELRSMWVYLAHWFDDQFDDAYAADLTSSRVSEEVDIKDILIGLDPRLGRLWDEAVKYTRKRYPSWNDSLFELGMRRLILSGPMFSPKCSRQHDAIGHAHRELVFKRLNDDYGVKELVRDVPNLFLAYTSKVVVEMWDSFDPELDFNLSMLMNLFYAPGLFYHDAEIEHMRDEITFSKTRDNPDVFRDIIGKVFDTIRRLPIHKQELATKPVRMFVLSFDQILDQQGLRDIYQEWR